MIKENLAIILGAGASKSYGFPLRANLHQEILKNLQADKIRKLLIGLSRYSDSDFLEKRYTSFRG